MAFIFAVLVIDSLGFGLIAPILPALVQKLAHVPLAHAAIWVGTLSMTFAATQFFAAPVLGQLSDRFGRRRLILISLAGSAANYILLAFAPTIGFLFIGRLIAGATAGNVSAATAYIADITPPEQRAQRFGMLGAAFGLGFMAGPLIGGFLGAIDLRLPFIAAAGLVALNVVYGVFVLPESLPVEKRRPLRLREATPLGAMRLLTTVPRLWRLAAAWSVRWFGIGVLQAVLVLFTELRFHWGPQQNGLLFAAVGIASTFVQFTLVKRAVALFGERRAALIGFGSSALGFLMFGLAPSPAWLFIGVVFTSLGSVANPAIRSMISRAMPADQQGRVAGALASIEGLTAIAAPLTAALVFDLFSRHTSFHLPGAPFVPGAPFFPGAPFVMVAAMLLAAGYLITSSAPRPVPSPPEPQA